MLTGSEAHEVNTHNKSLIFNMSREHTVFISRKTDSFYLIKPRFKRDFCVHALKGYNMFSFLKGTLLSLPGPEAQTIHGFLL